MPRPDKADPGFLLDMLLAAEDAMRFVAGMDEAAFHASELHQHAVMRCLEIIGEAAGRVSRERRATIASVPWSSVIGMRHKLVHDYDQIRIDRVWRTVMDDLPQLAGALRPLIPPPPQ